MKKSKNNSEGEREPEREPSTPILDMLIQLQGGWTPGSKTNVYDTRGVYGGDPIWCHTWDIAGKINTPNEILPLEIMSDRQLLAEMEFLLHDLRNNLMSVDMSEVVLALADYAAGRPGWQDKLRAFFKRMRTTFHYEGWQSQQYPDKSSLGVKPRSTKHSTHWRV